MYPPTWLLVLMSHTIGYKQKIISKTD